MNDMIEIFAFKVAGPVAAVLAGGVAVQASGVDITATDLGIAAVCLFLVDRVLTFTRGIIETRMKRGGEESQGAGDTEASQQSERQIELLERIHDELVDQRRFCRLNSPTGQREVAEAAADAVERRRGHQG